MKRYFSLISSIISLTLLVLMIQTYPAQPADAQSGTSNFTNVRALFDVTAGDDVLVGGHLGYTPKTAIVVSNGSTITPTGGLQYLTSAAATGTRLVVTGTVPAGTIQVFYNSGSNTITLTDTAPLMLSGNAALGAKDTIVLFNTGTEWIQVAPEGDN